MHNLSTIKEQSTSSLIYSIRGEKVMLIIEYLKQLEQSKQEETESKKRKRIGFKPTQNSLVTHFSALTSDPSIQSRCRFSQKEFIQLNCLN